MLVEFFVLGGVAFWFLVAIAVILGFVCTAWDDLWWLTVTVLVVAALLLVLTGDLGTYLVVAGPRLLWWIPSWFGVGLLWSFPRWIIFLRKGKRVFDDLWAKAQENETSRKYFSNSPELHRAVQDWGFDYEEKLVPPSAKEQVGRISSWILLWPWSMVWTVIGDGLVELTRWMVERLSGAYQWIARYVYS